MGIEEPRTINEMFQKAVRQRAGAALMSYKRDKKWFDISGKDLLERVSNLAVGLHKLGVKPGDRIALLAESSPDWSITDYAILSNSAVNVPIYPTQALDQVEFILKNSGARILFISTNRQLKRIKPVLDNYKNSERPLVYLFEEPKDASVSNIGKIEKQGAEELRKTPELFERISSLSQPSDLATIIYTSGTTGIPKGVMLTHHNLTSNALRSGEVFDLQDGDQAMSFLPLSHVFERTVLYIYMWYGVKVSFAKGVETVAEDIKEIRPTIVTAVPRLFEKIYATINKRASDATPLQQKIFHRALKVGRQVAGYIDRQERIPLKLSLEYKVLDRLVFSKWKEAVGGRIRFFVSGGAALPSEIAYIFLGAGIQILQGYGLTETSPVVSFNRPDSNRIGTIGKTIPGVKVRVAEDGEILVQGDNVMQGYYQLPEESAQVLQKYADGIWFHTGDIGTMDKEGYIRITDRKKDLMKTSLGKYIAPQPIENMIRSIPMVEQVIVIGNARKYPSALIVPTFDALVSYARSLKIDTDNPAELVRHPRVIEYFKKKIDEVTKDLAPHEKVKKIALLDQEFSVEGGELTPTLKVRRKFVEDKHKDTINSLYPKYDAEMN